jgi:hypothetical protein
MTAKAPALLLLAATALLLAGCTTPAANDGGSTDSGSDDSSSQSSGIDAKGTPCEDNTSGITLFSDASISQSPEYGQVWGDGSPLVIGYDDYTSGTLGYDVSYVQDDGAVIPVTGGFFLDQEGTTFTSTDPLFNSASDGYYGIIGVTITTDDLVTTELGAYCVVLAISE